MGGTLSKNDQSNTTAKRKSNPVFRVHGLLGSQPDDALDAVLKVMIHSNLSEEERLSIRSTTAIVPSRYNADRKTALVEFRGGVPAFLSELVRNPLTAWQTKMGDTDIEFDCHFFGFTQLYAPKLEQSVTSDIVAITGLDGHAYGSWRGKGNLGRMWLRDFLSEDLPRCRVLTYGYNSKLSSPGIDKIMDYGRELMVEIKQVRDTEELRQRPLFFIAHSFGGIILAHCLIKAVLTSENDRSSTTSIHKATYGILLFGTPHKGLVVDDIQKMLAGQDNHPRNGLLKQIQHKSDLLIMQLADFKNLIGDRKIVSFYETKQTRKLKFHAMTKRWGRTGDFITAVDADSALLQLPDHIEDKVPLDADHSSIVKFDSKNVQGYRTALDKLRIFERDAPRVIAARFHQQPSAVPFRKDPVKPITEDHPTRTDAQKTFGISISDIAALPQLAYKTYSILRHGRPPVYKELWDSVFSLKCSLDHLSRNARNISSALKQDEEAIAWKRYLDMAMASCGETLLFLESILDEHKEIVPNNVPVNAAGNLGRPSLPVSWSANWRLLGSPVSEDGISSIRDRVKSHAEAINTLLSDTGTLFEIPESEEDIQRAKFNILNHKRAIASKHMFAMRSRTAPKKPRSLFAVPAAHVTMQPDSPSPRSWIATLASTLESSDPQAGSPKSQAHLFVDLVCQTNNCITKMPTREARREYRRGLEADNQLGDVFDRATSRFGQYVRFKKEVEVYIDDKADDG